MNGASAEPATQKKRERAAWVDDVRGLGIVLVVIGHAIGGLQSAKIVSPDSGYGLAFQLIYSFHMPLFFLLSGLFAERFMRGSPTAHLGKSIVRLAYPYLLWSLITVGVIMSLGTLVNSPVRPSLGPFVAIPWAPPSQLWFLYALFVIQLAYIAASRYLGMAALLLVFLALRFVPTVVDMPDVAKMTLTYGVFFALGGLAAKPLFDLAEMSKPRPLALAAVTSAVWAVLALVTLKAGGGYLDIAMVPSSLAGIFAVLCLAMALPRSIEPAVRYLGNISMPIYLAHVLFVAGTRIVLAKLFGIENPALILPLLVASGIIGPLVLWEVSRRMGRERLLGFI